MSVEEPKFEPRRTVRAVVYKDGKFLLIKRSKPGDTYYTCTGGAIESGESEEEAVKRETMEETSIEVEVGRKIYEHKSAKWGDATFYLCEYVSGKPKVMPGTDEDRDNQEENVYTPGWFEVEGLDAPLVPGGLDELLTRDTASGFPEEPQTFVGE